MKKKKKTTLISLEESMMEMCILGFHTQGSESFWVFIVTNQQFHAKRNSSFLVLYLEKKRFLCYFLYANSIVYLFYT